jgi:teichuronic acid exporter
LTIERQAAAGLKWSSIAKLAGQVASWGVTLVVVRLLTPEDYGLMALCMVVVSALAGFAEFGLGSSLVQSALLEEKDLPQVAGAVFLFNIGAGLIIAIAAPDLATLLGDARLAPILQVLSIQFIFSAIDTVPASMAYRTMKFRRLAGVELSMTLFGAFVTLLLAWRGAGVWALVLGSLTSAALRMTLYVALGGFVWPSFDMKGIGPHVRFGGVVTVTRLLWQLTSQADILIAGRLFASNLVGIYAVSMQLATLPMSKVMTIINQVAFPAVARMQDEMARLRQRLLGALRLLALAAIPAMWGLSSVAPEFVDVILGERWQPAILPLQIVAFVTPLRMVQMVLATALTGVGRADLELRNTIVGAVVLPAAFLVGAQGGVNGLALSWLTAIPIVSALNFPRTLPPLGFRFTDLASAVRAPLIAGAVMYVAVSGTRLLLGEVAEWARLPVLILVGAAAYLVTVRVADRTVWLDVRKLALALKS